MKAISDGRKRKIPNVVCVMSEISRVGGWEFQGTYTGAVSIRGLQQCVKDRTVKNRRVHVVGGENPIRVARGITGGLRAASADGVFTTRGCLQEVRRTGARGKKSGF